MQIVHWVYFSSDFDAIFSLSITVSEIHSTEVANKGKKTPSNPWLDKFSLMYGTEGTPTITVQETWHLSVTHYTDSHE